MLTSRVVAAVFFLLTILTIPTFSANPVNKVKNDASATAVVYLGRAGEAQRTLTLERASRSEYRKKLLAKQREKFIEKRREIARRARFAAKQRREAAARMRAQAVATAASASTAQVQTQGSTEWDTIAKCESGGNWADNSGNGYSGGLQMDPEFWNTYDGTEFASAPYLASRDEQIIVATRARDGYKGYKARGYAPWPVCGR